ncbi:hypothetical protein M3650_07585 [Paenibacillus sp. MER TA 81-3]|uniref:hypothetical protein n=1 Tax=Paenibacillus sp. MER TA 81-3 TaxID=2939573 RepID=UPI00203C809F|nr:hypothetical protein [Paenibacillus sp. MER TA 81-3]MCM3338496.1 hypothetical protein [Paenibacillus sp. MER TA 81-3]
MKTAQRTLDKGIPIGLIGSEAVIPIMQTAVKRFPSFVPVIATYSNEAEVPKLVEQCLNRVEVILFSGPLPFKIAIEEQRFAIPVHFVPLTRGGLYRAFYHINKQFGLTSLSVDSVTEKDMAKTKVELNEQPVEVMYFEEAIGTELEGVIAFHRYHYNQGLAAAALTGIHGVAEALTEAGIPNHLIAPTEQDVVVALERALLSTETRRSKEAQIVVGMIHLDGFARLVESKMLDHEVQRLKLDIHRTLLGYVESLEGYLTPFSGDEYLFVTTRGIFEQQTGGYKTLPLAKELEQQFGLTLSVGIGFGKTANEAGIHARMALRHAKDAGGNIGFIIREDRSVIGPLEMTQPHEVDLSLIDADILAEATAAGCTTVYLSRLVAHITRSGQIDFYAQELADTLSVTVRSAHRFLLAWSDAGLVDVVGDTKGRYKGRPRQIYRMSFLSRLVR